MRENLKNILKRISSTLGWTRASYTIMSIFLLVIFLIMYIWWPLVVEYWAQYNPNYPFWIQFDWLLLGIFAFMSLMIMAGADFRKDLPIIVIGLFGGLVIESWGTQTELWTYYTFERPPLWIIPAWPIASLSIDRMYRLIKNRTQNFKDPLFVILYWLILPAFFALMVSFVWPTVNKSLTIMALILVTFLIATPTNYRGAVLTFIAGAGLGYYLELWGTTRLAWTYYTLEKPPLFAVLAHGMAALAFWRVYLLYKTFEPRLFKLLPQRVQAGD
ncbi:MAG: hypothetical protein DWQ07_13055 [Chloroflexi bacterium]|nr:MAG: hypothetical protein DWQ07_13055 [Chloroflexota bacterium]MBL1196969.1 hypothetical protein [Chloroflexota bacterium]NOH14265.1 hypothetical protein [Chloroflexota bacterium]